MRTIEFRGICNEEVHTHHEATEIGEWVYGYLVDKNHIRIPMSEEHGGIGSGVVYVDVEVLTETVGQFTGLYDKNDKKIFEGHIISINWKAPTEKCEAEILWSDEEFGWNYLTFGCKRPGNPLLELIEEKQELEIIGNIYEEQK